MLITVAICTYRRPDRVELALASLERQTYQGSDWEVLVVENDGVGTPAMKAVYERHKDKLPLRHVVEPRIGLSSARNTGARLSQADYVAYLDDDAEADPAWVAALVQECRESRPDYCGGPNYALYRTPKPGWYLDRYARGTFYGDHPRWLGRDEILSGHVAVKRTLFAQLGWFRTDLGMTGKTLGYGEDTEMLMRAWAANPQLRVRYLPEARVHHEVRPEKMTLRWNVRAAWATGRSCAIMSPSERRQAIIGLMRCARDMARRAGRAGQWRRQNEKECRHWQQWVYEEFCPWLLGFSRNLHALCRWQR